MCINYLGFLKGKLRRNFFWNESKKLHPINWSSILNQNIKGGFGLDNLQSRDLSFSFQVVPKIVQ